MTARHLCLFLPPLLIVVAALTCGVISVTAGIAPERLSEIANFTLSGGRLQPTDFDTADQYIAKVVQNSVTCRPDDLRNAAVIELQRLETAGQRPVDAQTNLAKLIYKSETDIRRALICAPTNGFLWYALSWINLVSGGREDERFSFLRMSYRTAPYEGWVAIRRNAFAVSQLDDLPKDLALSALEEFARIVDNGFYGEAFAILTGPGWLSRERLLGELGSVRSTRIAVFVRMLRAASLNLEVPGVTDQSRRPWN